MRFGALLALHRVSLEIQRGEILAIIGPNGAGKTTLLNVISGFYQPSEGRIRFAGADRTHLKPPDVAALGIARTFQNVALFKGMSVLDNIMTGRLLKMRGNILANTTMPTAPAVKMMHSQRYGGTMPLPLLSVTYASKQSRRAGALRHRTDGGKFSEDPL